MGRYTTVQIFSDSNPSMRTVTYSQAVGADVATERPSVRGDDVVDASTASSKDQEVSSGAVREVVPEEDREVTSGGVDGRRRVRVEKVDNPSGSTAGAGSGEFHVYRAARAREMRRIRNMDLDEEERVAEERFCATVEENRADEEKRTEKRRRKRQREKEAKLRKKNLRLAGVSTTTKTTVDVDESEFEYESTRRTSDAKESSTPPSPENPPASTKLPTVEIRNDGSFLETMKEALNRQNA